MGSGEQATPSKPAPKASSAQEQTPATSTSPATAAAATAAVYPDWSGFQAYSPVPPHGFFPSVASSPQAHPYMWGAQHIMSPYGTPPPPFIMYPHGGLYAHPSMPPGSHPFSPYAIHSPNGNPETSGAASAVEGKSSEGKEKSNVKQSKGSLGNLNTITGKNNNETSKTSGASANGVYSQSDDSSSEGSSEGTDANSQNDSEPNTTGGIVSYEAVASQNGGAQNGGHAPSQGTITQPVSMIPVPAAATSGGVVGPTTNLNIGMDYWGVPTPSQISSVRGKVPNASVGGLVPSGQNMPSELWLQDEREIKRQRRKQSNRESARRSRLRKQAEYEELAQRAESLKDENATLRAEASRLRKEYEQLLAQNNSLKEKLGEVPKETEDPRIDINGHHSGDDRQAPSDSDAQATHKDIMQSGR